VDEEICNIEHAHELRVCLREAREYCKQEEEVLEILKTLSKKREADDAFATRKDAFVGRLPASEIKRVQRLPASERKHEEECLFTESLPEAERKSARESFERTKGADEMVNDIVEASQMHSKVSTKPENSKILAKKLADKLVPPLVWSDVHDMLEEVNSLDLDTKQRMQLSFHMIEENGKLGATGFMKRVIATGGEAAKKALIAMARPKFTEHSRVTGLSDHHHSGLKWRDYKEVMEDVPSDALKLILEKGLWRDIAAADAATIEVGMRVKVDRKSDGKSIEEATVVKADAGGGMWEVEYEEGGGKEGGVVIGRLKVDAPGSFLDEVVKAAGVAGEASFNETNVPAAKTALIAAVKSKLLMAGVLVKAIDVLKGEWKCHRSECATFNNKNMLECTKCNEPKAWICNQCSVQNGYDMAECTNPNCDEPNPWMLHGTGDMVDLNGWEDVAWSDVQNMLKMVQHLEFFKPRVLQELAESERWMADSRASRYYLADPQIDPITFLDRAEGQRHMKKGALIAKARPALMEQISRLRVGYADPSSLRSRFREMFEQNLTRKSITNTDHRDLTKDIDWEWHDVCPILVKIETTEELQEALIEPSEFLIFYSSAIEAERAARLARAKPSAGASKTNRKKKAEMSAFLLSTIQRARHFVLHSYILPELAEVQSALTTRLPDKLKWIRDLEAYDKKLAWSRLTNPALFPTNHPNASNDQESPSGVPLPAFTTLSDNTWRRPKENGELLEENISTGADYELWLQLRIPREITKAQSSILHFNVDGVGYGCPSLELSPTRELIVVHKFDEEQRVTEELDVGPEYTISIKQEKGVQTVVINNAKSKSASTPYPNSLEHPQAPQAPHIHTPVSPREAVKTACVYLGAPNHTAAEVEVRNVRYTNFLWKGGTLIIQSAPS
jgi:hypothetical protein